MASGGEGDIFYDVLFDEFDEELDNEEDVEKTEGPLVIHVGSAVRRRASAQPVTKEERALTIEVHRAHLLLWISAGRLRMWSLKPQVLAAASERLSPDVRAEWTEDPSRHTLPMLTKLVSWFMGAFTISPAAMPHVQDAEALVAQSLHFATHFSGDQFAAAQAFVSVALSLGLRSRIVLSAQLISPKSVLGHIRSAASDASSPSASASSSPKKQEESPRKQEEAPASSPLKATLSDAGSVPVINVPPAAIAWAEVFLDSEMRWIAVDTLRGIVDQPERLDARPPLLYALAFDADRSVSDVTRRYASQWGARTVKMRSCHRFLESVLRPLRSRDDALRSLESAELEARGRLEVLPTSFEQFKNHPLYALERHLRKFECLYAREPILGYIRGEPVYPRECVKTLHSVEYWLKDGRVIRQGEKPAKVVRGAKVAARKSGGKGMLVEETDSTAAAAAAAAGETAPQVELFGLWQTKPYEPPVASGGIVPKNKYGNVDLYKPSMLPHGCVHINIRAAGQVARKLNIDYADAVTGFSFSGRRAVPVTQGIVVCAEFETVVREACEEHEARQDELARQRLQQQALANWRKLVNGAMVAASIRRKYGAEAEERQAKKKRRKEEAKQVGTVQAKVEEAELPPECTHDFMELFDEISETTKRICRNCGVSQQV